MITLFAGNSCQSYRGYGGAQLLRQLLPAAGSPDHVALYHSAIFWDSSYKSP